MVEMMDMEVEDDLEEAEEAPRVSLREILTSEGQTLLVKFDAHSSCVKKVVFAKLPFSLPDRPNNKTLMLSKIPPWATPTSVQTLLAKVGGPVKAVYFCRDLTDNLITVSDPSLWPPTDLEGANIRGYKCGFVVFEKAASMRSVLSETDLSAVHLLSSPEHPVASGLKKWKREYNARLLYKKTDLDNLAENVKTYVDQMDKAREELRKKAAQEAEPDDEGWVTVSRHSGKSRKPLGGATKKGQAKIKARDAKRKKRKELMDFYKFQTKEEKIDRLNELKERFEVDRQKQLKMKQDRQQRKFNS